MKLLKKKCIVLFCIAAAHALCANNRLLIIDTGFNDPYTCCNFLSLAESVGFKPDYKQFYEIDEKSLKSYGCIILNLDGGFVSNYFKFKDCLFFASPITQKIVTLMKACKNQKNTLIGLMLPSHLGKTIKNSCDRSLQLTSMVTSLDRTMKKSLRSFLSDLMLSDDKRSTHYHTTLLTKRDPTAPDIRKKTKLANVIDEITNIVHVGHLPLQNFLELPPLAWYCANQLNTHFFITKSSLLLFCDIGENFFYSPLDFSLRLRKIEEVQQLLFELYTIAVSGKCSKVASIKKPPIPGRFLKESILHQKKIFSKQRNLRTKASYDWINTELIWCGWGALDPYAHKEDAVVRTLLRSKLNLLWLDLNPEWYLARTAIRKKEKSKFLNQIKSFTKSLSKTSKETHAGIPHLFIGTDLTSNYAKHKVKNPVVDMYGNIYTKIPSPLDFEHFWKPEVLDVFDTFYSYWPRIGNSLPIAGLFFDFEMYHAQDQTGHYTSLMDFSDCAWRVYCNAHPKKNLHKLSTVIKRVTYLLKNLLFDDYFTALQHKAYAIGKKIKEHIRQKLPDAIFCIYDMHLPHAWFYKGMFASLSSSKEPIVLATFNNDFYCHYAWLIKNGIYAYHLPVLLLSKFKKPRDFDLINDISQFHDGVWFNRISRLEESRNPKDWPYNFEVETTPLETEVVVEQIRKRILTAQQAYQSK